MLKCLASDLSSNFQAHYKGQWPQNHTDSHRFSVLIYLISVPGCVGELSSSYLSDHLHNSSNYNAEYDQRWNKLPANLPPAVHLLSCHRTKIFRKPARWRKKFCYSVIDFQDTKWKYQGFNKLQLSMSIYGEAVFWSILHWHKTDIFLFFLIVIGTQCVYSGVDATRLHKCGGRRSASFLVGCITGYQ